MLACVSEWMVHFARVGKWAFSFWQALARHLEYIVVGAWGVWYACMCW